MPKVFWTAVQSRAALELRPMLEHFAETPPALTLTFAADEDVHRTGAGGRPWKRVAYQLPTAPAARPQFGISRRIWR